MNFFINKIFEFGNFFIKFLIVFMSFLLVSCGPPVYKNLTLLKNYDDNIKYAKAVVGENGAPSVEDIVGERFFNLFILSPKGGTYTFDNKTYQHRATITQNSDGTFKLKTSPIQFGGMPLAPIFEFPQLQLVKLENGVYSFVALKPGNGVFFSLPNSAYPLGYPMANYKNIKLVHAGTEILVVKENGKKRTMIKFALDFKEDVKTLPNGYLNIQAVITKETPGFKDFSDEDIKKLNDFNYRLLVASTASGMGTQMRGAAGTHCDYRIEFQGYRLKYTGIKTRPYLFNKTQSKFKRLQKNKICDYPTHLKGLFLDLNYKPVKDVEVTILDKDNEIPLINSTKTIKTNANGEFEISSKEFPELDGNVFRGFVRIKFKYTLNGQEYISYYPRSTTYADSEILRMQPNGYTNITAEMPDTSIRVKPSTFGGGISGNHNVFLYKADDKTQPFKTQKLKRSLAVLGEDRVNGLYDYTAIFKDLEPGKYLVRLETNDSKKDFWYTGKDVLNSNNVISAPNKIKDAAIIELKKDEKLTVKPTLAKELTTSLRFMPYISQPSVAGVVYMYEHILQDSQGEKLGSLSNNYTYYRNLIVGSKYKLGIRRKKCVRVNYLCDASFSKTQWLKELRVEHAKYDLSHILMTLDEAQAKEFEYIYLPEDHNYKDKKYPGVFRVNNVHAFVIQYDPSL